LLLVAVLFWIVDALVLQEREPDAFILGEVGDGDRR